MKCILTGVATFIVCGLLVALFLPSIRAGGAHSPKQLLIKVRVIDSDNVPVSAATVTFFGGRGESLADAQLPTDATASADSSAVTDDDGYADVTGSFRARDNRRGSFLHRNDAWYHLSGEWLKVVAPGRPVSYVWLNGHHFGSERVYENDEPLEVVVVLNEAVTQ